jgi:hypothetical protein
LVKYKADYKKYQEDIAKLRADGAKDWQIKMFEEYNTT